MIRQWSRPCFLPVIPTCWLTVLRVLLVPLFLAFLLVGRIPAHYLLALIVFLAASVTDSLDGYLARNNSQVTTFGKFLDPLADKILVLSAMISFIELGLCGSLVVVIMIAREFMVTSLRLVAVSGDGTVIAAGMLGKVKTAVQMVSIVLILILCMLSEWSLLPAFVSVPVIAEVLMWVSAVLSVVSGAQYIWKNRTAIGQMKLSALAYTLSM